MTKRDIFPVWWQVLQGRQPFLSIEITKECPLRCPGCYAYAADHLNNGLNLRQLGDYRGADLVERVVGLVQELRPLHLSIIGGEPLVRYRELGEILPRLEPLGVEVQVVTSAVRPIPPEWARLAHVQMVVSIDGLPADHNVRRAPATYDRILQHIAGHGIIVHCTVTRKQCRPGYLHQFSEFWSARPEVRRIWFSLYTPQEGEQSGERLTPADRAWLLQELTRVRDTWPKVHLPDALLDGYARPPQSPGECTFAKVTKCVSADLNTQVTPCQLGGKPVCAECGCVASAFMAAVERTRIAGLVSVSAIFAASRAIGHRWAGR